jgi:hypothetical protein
LKDFDVLIQEKVERASNQSELQRTGFSQNVGVFKGILRIAVDYLFFIIENKIEIKKT